MADKPRMEISASQVLGGALAAGSAAVAASLLGVYGTVIGAAVVSVLASIGGAVYTHSFKKGRQVIVKVRENRTGRMTRVVDGDPQPGDDTPTDTTHTEEPAETGGTAAADGKRRWLRSRLAGINPKAVAVTAACILVLSLGSILFAETLMDKPISSALGHDNGGGTTLSRLTGGDSSGTEPQDRSPTTTPTATPTTTVTETEEPTGEPKQRSTTSGPTRQSTTSEPETSEPTQPPPTSSEPTTGEPGGTSTGGSTDGGKKVQTPR